MAKFISKLRRLLGIEALNQSQHYREQTTNHIKDVNRMLTLNGEEDWMLNVCRKTGGNKKECYPNDNE